MNKKEFEDIIRPLVMLPNDQRKLLKEVLMNNFNKWAENKQLTLAEVSYPLCACGGNERVALDCTRKRCEHPKYRKSST